MLEHFVESTIDTLDACDRRKYHSLIQPLASDFEGLSADILGPVRRIPRHPVVLANFARSALLPAAGVAHQNGTVRFGNDPKTSALDVNCKFHELE